MIVNTQPSPANTLLKAEQVARRLNISRAKAYQLMQQGIIPTVRILHSVRVRESDLEEYIQRSWSGWIAD